MGLDLHAHPPGTPAREQIAHNTLKQKKLQLKLEQRERKDAILRATLARAKQIDRQSVRKGPRRQPVDALQRYLAVPVDDTRCLREAAEFRTRRYSLEHQVMELIQHLFVRYPVPEFLYRTVLSPDGRQLVRAETKAVACRRDPRQLVEWEHALFFAVASGKSVAKLLASELTKKECHHFLNAPAWMTARQALEWARLGTYGIPAEMAGAIIGHLDARALLPLLGARRHDLYRALASDLKWLRMYRVRYILDWIAVPLRNPDYSFAGRTGESLYKASQEWHRANSWGTLDRLSAWRKTLPDWSRIIEGVPYRVHEICSAKALHEETHRMGHCVFTYLSACESGESSICTMQIFDAQEPTRQISALTIEVSRSSRSVVQVRGRFNRSATFEEVAAVGRFARDNGLRVAEYSF